MTDIERDAARYRWIKAAPRLRIERMPDSHFWISAETGKKYSVTHSLSAFDTGFSGLPTLDELVDQAMEMYPIPDEMKTKSPVEQAYKDWWGEYPETGDWDATDDARWLGFRAGYHMAYQEKVTTWEPTPQTPNEIEQGLKNAFKAAKEAGVFDDLPSDKKQRILHQSKQVASYMEMRNQPFWPRLGSKVGSYNLGPVEIANILELIAEEVEHRGTIDYDRDPGETAEWLMHEAQSARQSMNP